MGDIEIYIEIFIVFRNFESVVKEIIDNFLPYVESYKTFKYHQLVICKESLLSSKLHPQGKVKLNFDGALFDSSGICLT